MITHRKTIILYSFALALCALFLCSCATSSYQQVRIAEVPAPQIIAKGNKPKMMEAGFLKMRLRKQLPELEDFVINDQHYVYIGEEWFFQLNEWTDTFIAQQVPDLDKKKLPEDYKQAYTMFMSSVANLAIAKHHNIKSSALIGIVVAKNVQPWKAIPATGEDMSYIIVMDDNYMMIYDLITEQFCDIFHFPNFKHITEIIF